MTDRLAGKVAIADIIEPAAGLTNGGSLFISCDLRSAKQIGHMATRTIDRFGRIDILVNNAGKTGGSAATCRWSLIAPFSETHFGEDRQVA